MNTAMSNMIPKRIDFKYTSVVASPCGAFIAEAKYQTNGRIYKGKFELSTSGTLFDSLDNALKAAAKYEQTMKELNWQHAK